jgi:hypothetical protein
VKLNVGRGLGAARPSQNHRLKYHALVVTIGLIAGGTIQAISRQFLPPGPAKEFLTTGLAPYLPAIRVPLILLEFTFGPAAIDVSVLSLLGILIAYLIARSLF